MRRATSFTTKPSCFARFSPTETRRQRSDRWDVCRRAARNASGEIDERRDLSNSERSVGNQRPAYHLATPPASTDEGTRLHGQEIVQASVPALSLQRAFVVHAAGNAVVDRRRGTSGAGELALLAGVVVYAGLKARCERDQNNCGQRSRAAGSASFDSRLLRTTYSTLRRFTSSSAPAAPSASAAGYTSAAGHASAATSNASAAT